MSILFKKKDKSRKVPSVSVGSRGGVEESDNDAATDGYERVDGPNRPEAIALYPSPINNPYYTYLPFKKGQRMEILEECNEHWWRVKSLLRGEEGFVPANYVAKLNSVTSELWFHKDLFRADAIRKLISMTSLGPGGFLVRPSSNRIGYALDVKMGPRSVKHFHVLMEGGKYMIEKERQFESVGELIGYYQRNSTAILKLKLSKAVNRPKPSVARSGDVWEIDREQLSFRELLGAGHFGKVTRASWSLLDVAVKELKQVPGRSQEQIRNEFHAESEILKTVNHENLVQLYGVSTSEYPFYIITEYMAGGSLVNYMKKQKRPLEFEQNIEILLQVAKAMEYLEERKIVHRDLAARNILVGDIEHGHPVVKVSDFGLTRQLGDDGYYFSHSLVPIRWTAPEALLGKYGPKSDVWSFGVVIFEVFLGTGDDPYIELGKHLSIARLHSHLKDGYRLKKPERCPTKFHEEITSLCFQFEKESRPPFKMLCFTLARFELDDLSRERRAMDGVSGLRRDMQRMNLENQ